MQLLKPSWSSPENCHKRAQRAQRKTRAAKLEQIAWAVNVPMSTCRQVRIAMANELDRGRAKPCVVPRVYRWPGQTTSSEQENPIGQSWLRRGRVRRRHKNEYRGQRRRADSGRG